MQEEGRKTKREENVMSEDGGVPVSGLWRSHWYVCQKVNKYTTEP